MAIVATKPKKKPALKSRLVSNRLVNASPTGPIPGAARASSPSPVAAPKPAAPVLDPVPPVVAPPRVTLPSSTADRATAGEQFGGSLAMGNRGLRDLAQGLGGLSSVGQFGFDPGADPRGFGTLSSSQLGIDPNDPNSTMATIGRNLGKNLNFVGDTNLNRNTWTGGLRLTEEDEQRTNAANARAKATSDYAKANADLIDQISGGAGAYGSFKGAIRGSNAADDAATAAAAAVAQAQAPPPAAPAPAAMKPGTNIPIATPGRLPTMGAVEWDPRGFYVSQGVGGVWHEYPDGTKRFVRK